MVCEVVCVFAGAVAVAVVLVIVCWCFVTVLWVGLVVFLVISLFRNRRMDAGG